MTIEVVLNGITYDIPEPNDARGWGQQVTNFLAALPAGVLTKSGGAVTMLAEADLGATYGLRMAYLRSKATNPATVGAVRLGCNESIGFRNVANGANNLLGVNTSDQLTLNGVVIAGGGGGGRPDIYIYPETYGALGDGVTNDYAAFVLAIAESQSTNKPLYLSAKNYLVNSQLAVSSILTIVGCDADNSLITAGASMDAQFLLTAQVNFSNFTIDGARLAKYGVRCAGAGSSQVINFQVARAIVDGWYMESLGINDGLYFFNFRASNNGKAFYSPTFEAAPGVPITNYLLSGQGVALTGTASVTAGATTIIGTGTNFLSATNWRQGDLIRIGSGNTGVYEIQSIDSNTQITLGYAAPYSNSGQYAIGVGRGYNAESFNDNNINHFQGGLLRFNAGGNSSHAGLYGDRIYSMQSDACPFPAIKIGVEQSVCINTIMIGCYFEEAEPAPVLISNSTDGTIGPNMTSGYTTPYINLGGPDAGVQSIIYGTMPSGVIGMRPAGSSDGYTSFIPVTQSAELDGFTLNGALVDVVKNFGAPTSASITLDEDFSYGNVSPGADPTVNAAVPFMNTGAKEGQRFRIHSTSANAYILNDENLTAGNKLKLATDTVVIESGETLELQVNGAYAIEVGRSINPAKTTTISVSADRTVGREEFVFSDATGAARLVTLPTASARYKGRKVGVMKTDVSANTVTVVGTINGAANLVLAAQYDKCLLVCDGVAWFKF